MGAEATLVQWAAIPSDLKPIQMFDGSSPEPIQAEYLAASRCPSSPTSDKSFCLYFLDRDGRVLEVLQWETLEILIDQARDIVGLGAGAWVPCRLPVPNGDVFDVSQFPRRPAG